MPIRINPVKDFGPCTIYFTGIEKISDLVDSCFQNVKFSASNDMWEVYDENKGQFLGFISPRRKLDSFYFVADTLKPTQLPPAKSTEITAKAYFDTKKSNIVFTTTPENEEWVKWFIDQVDEQIDGPSFSQRMNYRADIKIPFVLTPLPYLFYFEDAPRCRILAKKRVINPRTESFLINIIASIAIAVIFTIFGILLATLWGGFSGAVHYIKDLLQMPAVTPTIIR
jgi:hypothetical protein